MDEIDNNGGDAEYRADCTTGGRPLGPAHNARLTDGPRTKSVGAKTQATAKGTGAAATHAQGGPAPQP